MADNLFEDLAQPTANDDGDIVKLPNVLVTTPGFTGGIGTLTTAHTSSAQRTSTGGYYLDVYQSDTSSADAAVQFSISYGHAYGSASTETNNEKPTRVVYRQYKNLLLADAATAFSFVTQSVARNSDHIYVLNFKRERIKDYIDPTTFQFSLSSSALLTLKSMATASLVVTNTKWGRSFPIVSSSVSNATSTTQTYGRLYADLGIAVLDPSQLELYGAVDTLNTGSETTNGALNNILFRAISGAQVTGNTDMTMRATETVDSNIYFVRVRSNYFNESSNPTYYLNGRIRSAFASERIAYITTVGLYNDANELLAIAKVSQPILKKRGTEALIKVKTDF